MKKKIAISHKFLNQEQAKVHISILDTSLQYT